MTQFSSFQWHRCPCNCCSWRFSRMSVILAKTTWGSRYCYMSLQFVTCYVTCGREISRLLVVYSWTYSNFAPYYYYYYYYYYYDYYYSISYVNNLSLLIPENKTTGLFLWPWKVYYIYHPTLIIIKSVIMLSIHKVISSLSKKKNNSI